MEDSILTTFLNVYDVYHPSLIPNNSHQHSGVLFHPKLTSVYHIKDKLLIKPLVF